MAAADWTSFEWELTESNYCDDGVCTLFLRLPNGWSSVPEVLRYDSESEPGIMQPTTEPTDCAREAGEASMLVLQRGWFGGIGIVVPIG